MSQHRAAYQMNLVKMALLLFVLAIHSQSANLLVIPIQGDTAHTEEIKTLGFLFQDALRVTYSDNVIEGSDTLRQCKSTECISRVAAEQKAEKIIAPAIYRLGEKWILSATLYDSKGKGIRTERITARIIEDLEPALGRLSDALLTGKTLEQVVTVNNIMEKEAENEPLRRKSYWTTGISLGYLYPLDNSYSRTVSEYDYTSSAYKTYHEKQYSQMIQMAWTNGWQFNNKMMLGADVMYAIPLDFGADLNLLYLPKVGDFTPFVGGGIGLHYVMEDDNGNSDKRNSGPTVNMQGGMMLFRTYNVNVMARGQYRMILNDDFDNGVSMDVAVQWKKDDKRETSSGWSTFWKVYLVLAIVGVIAGAAAGS